MVLEQDKPQASQAQAVLDEQQYQKDLAQYNKDLAAYDKQQAENEKKYQKELAQYNKDKAQYDKLIGEYNKKQKKIADAKAAEQTRIAEEKRKEQEKADKRTAQFAEVEKQYQETLSNNPYTDEERQKQFAVANKYGQASKLKFNYSFDKQSKQYNEKAKQDKIEAEKKLREQHYTADGYNVDFTLPVNFKDKRGVIKYVEEKKHLDPRKKYGGRNAGMSGYGTVGVARHWLLEGKITIGEYQKLAIKGHQEWQTEHDKYVAGKVAKSQAKVAGQVAADRSHWANVTSGNYDAKNPGHNFSDDIVTAPKEHGYAADNIMKMVNTYKNNNTVDIPIKPTAPIIPVRTNTSSVKGVNEANIIQKQYVQDLRDGKVGLAQALLKPQTPQRYSPGNTVNLKQYLTERGYDINRPETIPDSVLTTPVKYDAARKQARYAVKTETPMGDLRSFIPQQPRISDAVLQQRQKAMANIAASKGGSFIGYGDDGTPVQGPPKVSTETKWTVTDPNKTQTTTIPTMLGESYVVQAPVSYTFETKEEAESFAKTLQPQQNKIKTDNEFVNALRYSDLVDSGEVINPKDTPSLADDILYYSSAGLRPIYNIGLTGYNLAQDKQVPTQPTTLESFAGGLIESGQFALSGGQEGRPLEQTMGDTWKYVSSDPLRSIVEIPAEVGIGLLGGKALQGIGKVGIVAKESLKTSAKTPQVIKTTIETAEKVDFKVKMMNPIAKKNYQKTQEIAKDLYTKDKDKAVEIVSGGKINKPNYNVEMIDSKTFLITAGTETAPVKTPAVVVRYGKEGLSKTERQSTIFTEYEASVMPIKAVKVRGDMQKNLMQGVKQTGKFEYVIPATPTNMATLSSKEIINVIKPVGYEIAEPTSNLSKSMRAATISAAEDPTIQKSSMTVLGEIQARKWFVKPRDDLISGTNKEFYKKTPFTDKKPPEETISKPVDVIVKGDSITPESNEALKTFARQSVSKTSQNYLPNTSSLVTSEIVQTVSAPIREMTDVSVSVKTDVRSVQSSDVITSTIQSTKIKQITSTKIKQITSTKQVTRQRTRQRQRPGLKSRAKLGTRLAVTNVPVIDPTISKPARPARKKAVVWLSDEQIKKEKERKSRKKKRKDFLGNTRLDKIEGLFRRSEIITGDKRVAKQEKLDRAFKENKKKTRRKKTKQSFSQKMGIVSKGFKI